jgi:hypothetical protein
MKAIEVVKGGGRPNALTLLDVVADVEMQTAEGGTAVDSGDSPAAAAGNMIEGLESMGRRREGNRSVAWGENDIVVVGRRASGNRPAAVGLGYTLRVQRTARAVVAPRDVDKEVDSVWAVDGMSQADADIGSSVPAILGRSCLGADGRIRTASRPESACIPLIICAATARSILNNLPEAASNATDARRWR